MIATFNGWDDQSEVEREALEQWEEGLLATTAGLVRQSRSSGFFRGLVSTSSVAESE